MTRSKRNRKLKAELEQMQPVVARAQGQLAAAIMHLSRLLGDPRNAQEHSRMAVLNVLSALDLIGVEVDVDDRGQPEPTVEPDRPSDEGS